MIFVATVVIIAIVCSVLTATAAILYYKAELRTVKADFIVALSDQATLSFRQGYMRAYGDRTKQHCENQKAKNVYQSAML